jgi:hypothetical protein
VNVGVVWVVLADGIVCDVLLLRFEVVIVADAVFVITGVPDFSGELVADGERISSLYELDAAGRALIDCGGDQDVEMA